MKLDTNDLEFADKICRAWWTVGEALKKWLRAKTREMAQPNQRNGALTTDVHDSDSPQQ